MTERESTVIRQLRTEAIAAGDVAMAADCTAALAGDEAARLRCHNAIEAAAAMDDGG